MRHSIDNINAYGEYSQLATQVATEGRESGYPVRSDLWDAYEAASAHVFQSAMLAVKHGELDAGDVLYSVDFGRMKAANVCHTTGTVVLTKDGKRADASRWHDGQSSHDVEFEVWTAEGRISHGYINDWSRRITQWG
jgi:hypothetical protein